MVVIDPIRTATAEAADWFVQPLPGTDVALMLGMMHVLIAEELIDRAYVDAYTTGFDRLAEHVAEWTPERAAGVCGLDPGEIERLARAYGSTRPALIRTLIGAEHHEHGAMFFRTLACLPALTGAWRDRGGGLARSVGSWSEVNVDDTVFDARNLAGDQERRAVNMNHLGRALTAVDDPRVMALFVWNGNPAVTVPNAQLTRRGLEREDLFCVVSEQFLTDTARYADVVFPAATQIEQLDVVPSWGHLYLGWNEPAIAAAGRECSEHRAVAPTGAGHGLHRARAVRIRRVAPHVRAAAMSTSSGSGRREWSASACRRTCARTPPEASPPRPVGRSCAARRWRRGASRAADVHARPGGAGG